MTKLITIVKRHMTLKSQFKLVKLKEMYFNWWYDYIAVLSVAYDMWKFYFLILWNWRSNTTQPPFNYVWAPWWLHGAFSPNICSSEKNYHLVPLKNIRNCQWSELWKLVVPVSEWRTLICLLFLQFFSFYYLLLSYSFYITGFIARYTCHFPNLLLHQLECSIVGYSLHYLTLLKFYVVVINFHWIKHSYRGEECKHELSLPQSI